MTPDEPDPTLVESQALFHGDPDAPVVEGPALPTVPASAPIMGRLADELRAAAESDRFDPALRRAFADAADGTLGLRPLLDGAGAPPRLDLPDQWRARVDSVRQDGES